MSSDDTWNRDDDYTPGLSLPIPFRAPGCGGIMAFLSGIGCLIISVILLCAGVVFVSIYFFERSAPYKMALKKVQTDPQVVQQLGQPIEEIYWIPAGSLRFENDSGSANYTFPVQGPKGEATVSVVARMIDGKWGLTELTVTYPDGTRQMLDVADTGSSEMDAPKWTPDGGGEAVPDRDEVPGPRIPATDHEGNPAGPEINLEVPQVPNIDG